MSRDADLPVFSFSFAMRIFSAAIILLSSFFLSGCTDQPEIEPAAYGTVVNQLPFIQEAEAPFNFPFAGDTDHSKCVFKEEDFM